MFGGRDNWLFCRLSNSFVRVSFRGLVYAFWVIKLVIRGFFWLGVFFCFWF